MKKSTISLIGILCMLAGGLFFFSNEPTALYLGVGMLVIGIIIIVAVLLGLFKSFIPYQHQDQQQFSYAPNPVQQTTAAPPKRESSRDVERKEQRRKELDAEIQTLKTIIQNEVWGIEDVRRNAYISLDSTEVQYIAQQLPTPFFAITVWELHQKITEQRLADNEMFKILDDGSDSLQKLFIESYSNSSSWTMSSTLLEYLISKNPLMIFSFDNIRKETVSTIIDRLSVYELLGYRMKPNKSGEDFAGSFVDFQKSTSEDEVEISYYDSINTNMLHYLEEYHPNETALRQKAFTKILAGSTNVISMIRGVDDLSEDEIRQIFVRNYKEEISALFDRFDAGDIVVIFPPLYAVKVALQLVECDYENQVDENYNFENIPVATYQQIVAELSADELLGYDDRGSGSYDIIKLFEDHSIGDEALRKTAFAKMRTSNYFCDAIARWESVSEDEVKIIMDNNDESHIKALLGRDDSDDIIISFPEDVAIKIRLQLIYPDACDTVQESYQFNDEDAFKKVIAELSANELLGFKVDPENSELFSNDADYDIISFIEDEMGDNDTLRTLAFAKICKSDDMSDAIARWESISESEVVIIVERGKNKEMTALFERDDIDSIITDIPDKYIITQYLLDDDNDNIKDEFNSRINDQKFTDKVKKMAKSITTKALTNDEKEGSVEDISDEKVIRIKLCLMEIDDCSFDNDDIESEYSDRMSNNEEFVKKIKTLVDQTV